MIWGTGIERYSFLIGQSHPVTVSHKKFQDTFPRKVTLFKALHMSVSGKTSLALYWAHHVIHALFKMYDRTYFECFTNSKSFNLHNISMRQELLLFPFHRVH